MLADLERPGPPYGSACPAREGKGTDISTAEFTFVAEDCVGDRLGRTTVTEIFGYFRLAGDEHENDALVTAKCEVPVGSPIARMAHQVSAGPGRQRTVGAMLRRNVASCSCTADGECPALGLIRLVEALEHATGIA